jgi:uncharacterized membrane protein
MNYEFLLYSFLNGTLSFLLYIFFKWSKEKESYMKITMNFRKVKHWGLVIGFAMASLVYLLKSIGQL